MRRRTRVAMIGVVLVAGFTLTACPAQPATPECPGTPTGTWWGSWQSTSYPTLRRGVMSAQLTFTGGDVTGTVVLDGSGAGSGTVTGSVSCGDVSLQIQGAGPFETMNVSGTLHQDALGTTLTATYASQAFTIPTTIADQAEQGHLLLAWPG